MACATEMWWHAHDLADRAGLHHGIGPLSCMQTSMVDTVVAALAIVNPAAWPGLKTMPDTSSVCATEAEQLSASIDRVWPGGQRVHVQLVGRNRCGPGQGDDRFAPLLAARQRQRYASWLPLEPFDHQSDGSGRAAHSIGCLRGQLQTL